MYMCVYACVRMLNRKKSSMVGYVVVSTGCKGLNENLADVVTNVWTAGLMEIQKAIAEVHFAVAGNSFGGVR